MANVLNSLQRAVRVPQQINKEPTNNSIANDFLRRGSIKAITHLKQDKAFDPEATIKGYLYAALNYRKENFADYAEENLTCEDKESQGLTHPYLDLIENSKNEDVYEFWRDLINDYDMTGEAYIFLLRRVVYKPESVKGKKREVEHIGLPTSIEQLDSNTMEILYNGSKEIIGYRQRLDDNHVREFLPEQIIRVYNKHPLDPTKPLSIFDACKDYQYTINKGSEYAQSALLNSTNMPGIISVENELSDEEYDNLVARINGHEAGKWMVTDGVSKLSIQSVDQTIDNKISMDGMTEVNRQTIFAVTGTSKTVLGIEESGTTRDTARIQEMKFIKRTIKPLVKRFISALNFDFRTSYPERYKSTGLKLVLKSAADPTEDMERYGAQKALFDDTQAIVYSGYTPESAEQFMNGEIDFTELRADETEIDGIEDEQSSGGNKSSDDSGNDDEDQPDDGSNNNGISEEELERIDVENQATHIHDFTTSDDYVDKALRKHFINGELSEYGKLVKTQANKAKDDLLKEVRRIQLDAIRESNTRLAKNDYSLKDIRTEEEEKSLYKRLFNAFKKYWYIMIPLISRERLAENKEDLDLQADVNLLGTKAVQDYIKDMSDREAKSHVKTIYDSILEAANKGFLKATEDLFADEYLKNYKQGEDNWFKTKPTKTQIKSKLKNDKFLSENEKMYKYAQDKIADGYNFREIQKMIRQEYVNLSRKRANLIVGNEMAKAVNSSQFLADYELLKATNNLDKAYKRLVSSTGEPCPICEEIINRGEIPFTDNFVELGDQVQATRDGKTSVMVFNYEPIQSGVVHPNCHCSYQLVIKNGVENEANQDEHNS